MKLTLTHIQHPRASFLEIPFKWKTEVNLLILVHVIFFGLHIVAEAFGLGDSAEGDSLNDFVQHSLALPGPSRASMWFGNIFTYQFIHFDVVEFVMSMVVLWFFGNILGSLIGYRRVIVLYMVTVMLAALAFLGSHVVFAIFSGRATIMEGAFAGALGVMTATVVLLRSYDLRISTRHSLPLLLLYTIVVVTSVLLIFKPSMAYVLVYLASIAIGVQYGRGNVLRAA